MQEVAAGLKSKKKHLMDKGMSEKEALKELEELQNEKIGNQKMFGLGNDRVEEE